MRIRHFVLCSGPLALLSLYACSPHSVQPEPTGALCRTEAYFSRRGGAAPALINALDQARSSIRVAIYSITNRAIVNALVAAKRRGVDVAVKTDKAESEHKNQAAMIAQLQAGGVPVEVSTQVRHLHHKFAVIDDSLCCNRQLQLDRERGETKPREPYYS